MSGLPSDSDEDTTQKQERDVSDPQRPYPAVSELSEQQDQQQELKAMRKDSRGKKINNEELDGTQKEVKINLKSMYMTALLVSHENELLLEQRIRGSTDQKHRHAGAAKSVRSSSQDLFHKLTESKEEETERQSNNNARTQRNGTEEGLLSDENTLHSGLKADNAQNNAVKSVPQGVVTSTPLQRKSIAVGVTTFLESPVTEDKPKSTVKKKRGIFLGDGGSEEIVRPSSKELIHILSDSEEEGIDKQINHNARTQRNGTEEALLSDENTLHSGMKSDNAQNHALKSFPQGLVTSTPLQGKRIAVGVTTFLESPVTVDKPKSTVEKKRGIFLRDGGSEKIVRPSSKELIHILSDSEEEGIDTQINHNARTQRNGTEEGLLSDENTLHSGLKADNAQNNAVKSVPQGVVTSTPLQRKSIAVGVTTFLESPVTEDKPKSTVKKKRGIFLGDGGSEEIVRPSSKELIHILSDSEEEGIDKQINHNARTQRNGTEEGLLSDENTLHSGLKADNAQNNAVKSVPQGVVTSTPLQRKSIAIGVTTFLESPVTEDKPKSTVKKKRGIFLGDGGSEEIVHPSSKELIHILSDSEEEGIDKQINHNARTQRNGTEEGLLSDENTLHSGLKADNAQNNAVKSIPQGVVTSTPLQRKSTAVGFTTFLESPVTEDKPKSTVKKKRGIFLGDGGSEEIVRPSSKELIHILSDSEEEGSDTQINHNASTQRNFCYQRTQKVQLPDKSGQQSAVKSGYPHISTVKSFHQHVVTGTPLQTTRLPCSVTSSLPSLFKPAKPPSTFKTRRREGLPVAESEKMTVSADEDLDQAAVVPGSYEEIKRKYNDDPRELRTSPRRTCSLEDYETSDGEEDIIIVPSQKCSELKSGSPANIRGRSSKRTVPPQRNLHRATVVPGSNKEIKRKFSDYPKQRRTSLRKLFTAKDFGELVDQEDPVMFSTTEHRELKSSLSANLRERSSDRFNNTIRSRSTCNLRKSPGVKENAQDIADDKNHLGSSQNYDEIKHQNKRVKRSHWEKKRSSLEPSEMPALRQSTRKRVKTLDYWRGERIQYKTGIDGCCEVESIVPGFPTYQWVPAREHQVHYKKERFQFPQDNAKETCSRKLVLVPYGNENCELECFSTLRIDADVTECVEDNFTLYTGLEVPGMSTGYVEIGPFYESCSVIDSNMVFYILVGKVTVTIHETTRKVREKEFFFVPKGVSHTLKNDAEMKVLLLFTKYDN